ncbi:MAG: MerR family transcriptional regulator [Desulfovibrionales bacterium]
MRTAEPRMAEHKTYKIGQAASLVEVEPYVLRFWESEFPELTPVRTEKGQRLYTEEHIDLIRRIKVLLYDKGMTIEGARRHLQNNGKYSSTLREIRTELLNIRRLLTE